MKIEADKSRMKTTGNSTERRGNTSKNSEIETYLRAHYVFRYNTVLDRTEYRSNKDVDCRFTKVGRYEINSLRRELDLDMGIITSSDKSLFHHRKQLFSTHQSHTGILQGFARG